MPLPGPDGPGASVAGGTSFVMFRTSKHKAAAWKLIEYLSEPGGAGRFHAPDRRPAAAALAWDDPALANDPYARAFRDPARARRSRRRRCRNGNASRRKCGWSANRWRNGRMSVDEAAAELDRRADAILEKRRWMLDAAQPAPPERSHEAVARRLDLRRAGAAGDRAVLLPAGGRRAGAEPHRFRPLRAGRHRTTCASSASTTTSTCCRTRCSGRRWATRCISSSSACRCRSRCRWARRCCCIRSSARFKGFFRTAFFAPVVTTVVAVAVIWRYLFHTRYGLVNWGLSLVGIDPVDWLGDPHWAMPTIILFAVWKNFGYNMIIFLAGLQAIPRRPVRGRAHRRRRRCGSSSATSPCRCWGRCCCWSAS